MKLTKYTHSCVRLENDSQVLVIDPGTFSESAEALDGAHNVLITHEHPDHIDEDAVLAAMNSNPDLQAFAPGGVAEQLRSDAGESGVNSRIIDVLPETALELPGFNVKTFGGQHALIHPLIPMVANIGYLINDDVYHPGDSFTVPHGLRATTLLVPLHAPWSKAAEVIDFVIAVGADRAFPIHEALLNETGLKMVEGHVQRIGSYYGTEYRHLDAGESVEL
ncbi:MBL fold metallo-hydrolase [Arthrobacter sp. H14]|uniref:MBL fold metallo-hydrolase n=1 Tax=Arthrobacter sp. H14 TaxID=1312959 RepID=UPI00047C4522|nr:MBL fold metallo-hydrolase [Arthrobacter sp. H14]